MSGASVVHTTSDYDIDGMDMGRGRAISGRTGTRGRRRNRPWLLVITDKGFASKESETDLAMYTAAGPSRASLSASPNASSHWPQRSGTTTRPDSQSDGP